MLKLILYYTAPDYTHLTLFHKSKGFFALILKLTISRSNFIVQGWVSSFLYSLTFSLILQMSSVSVTQSYIFKWSSTAIFTYAVIEK